MPRVQAIKAHALAIQGTPRSSAMETCLPRMRADFATIDALTEEIKGALPTLPFGSVGLLGMLSAAKSCVDCSDDRGRCGDMAEPATDFADLLTARDKLIASDKKALAALK